MPDSKPTILCVDDEAIPLMLRKSVLQKSGFQVLGAGSGKEALEVLDREHVDLVLTDLLMPGLSGTDLARQIKQRHPGIPVILLSGVNEMPEDAESADLFLSKVEGPVAMCEKISQTLSHPRNSVA